MKAIIYYFSATGNSLKVARDLAQELNGAVVYPVTKALKENQDESYNALGIVFPVYMFGLPLIIVDFLKYIKVRPGAYFFSVATLGGLPGRAHSLAKKILCKRDIKLAAGFSVLMPGNYTPLYGAIPNEQQEKMFTNEKNKIKNIAEYVRLQKRVTIEEKPFLINLLLYKLLYWAGSRTIPDSDKGFWINDACTKCGLCEKVCPVANIRLKEGRPEWLHNCQHCMACLQWCPVEAVQYKKSTHRKKRYHHPLITAQDITEQR
ncbi:MAG: EFR1 family ferrodoxin [Candidatus Omnitrophota bacterium]